MYFPENIYVAPFPKYNIKITTHLFGNNFTFYKKTLV